MSQIDNSENSIGLILTIHYIPEEILIQILTHVDYMDLVSCHLVCKQWNEIIKQKVWRKKAESVCGKLHLTNNQIPWNRYFYICNKEWFKRNLLTSTNLNVVCDEEFKFTTLNVYNINVSPCEDPIFQENIHCIQINHDSIVSVQRKFVIDLIKEGFNTYILDNIQPAIEISEWYCCEESNQKAEYQSTVKLINVNDPEDDPKVMRVYHFHKRMNTAEKQGKWFKFTHVMKNYGPGLRVIKFYDGGHHDIIMAAGSVIMTFPSRKHFF